MTALISTSSPGAPMPDRKAWLFRPPRLVAFEDMALNNGLLVPDFGVYEDLRHHFELGEVLAELELANPGETRTKLESWASQLHNLLHMIQPGELIVMPLRRRSVIAIGMARPEVETTEDGRPGRRVEWLKTDIPLSSLMPDLIHSLNAQQYVCSITRNEAPARLRHLLQNGIDPGPAGTVGTVDMANLTSHDVETMMRARMIAKIGSSFAGHSLADLVASLLEVDGYKCHLSPPGPDGGVDILAGQGLTGLTGSMVVQVKSGDIVADGPTYQQLVGAVAMHKAQTGLLVCWSGVTRAVKAQMRDNWFAIRVWDAHDICAMVERHYEQLPLQIRDRLGFRKILVF